jgi:hypothetical protein
MRGAIRRAVVSFVAAALAFGRIAAGDEKAIMGSYRLAKRVMTDGKELTGPEVVGFMTFAKGYRTTILSWIGTDGKRVSISLIAGYTLSGGKYCESETFGTNADLGTPGVTYDAPSPSPKCTAAISDASGLAFDVPGEKLRLHAVRDGILATTPHWTDHWEKVK